MLAESAINFIQVVYSTEGQELRGHRSPRYGCVKIRMPVYSELQGFLVTDKYLHICNLVASLEREVSMEIFGRRAGQPVFFSTDAMFLLPQKR